MIANKTRKQYSFIRYIDHKFVKKTVNKIHTKKTCADEFINYVFVLFFIWVVVCEYNLQFLVTIEQFRQNWCIFCFRIFVCLLCLCCSCSKRVRRHWVSEVNRNRWSRVSLLWAAIKEDYQVFCYIICAIDV